MPSPTVTSPLERLPLDVLRHIAFLSAAGSPFESTHAIASLLRTCSTVHAGLSLHGAADLYANIFAVKFDISALHRRYRGLVPDSARAGQLVNRFRLLKRAKRVDLCASGLLQDLWTGLGMLLENDGLNEQQLACANFSAFLWALMRCVLGPNTTPVLKSRTENLSLQHITVWLLCLSLRRQVILDMPKPGRNELYDAVFPFIFTANKISGPLSSINVCTQAGIGCHRDQARDGDGLSGSRGSARCPPHDPSSDYAPCACATAVGTSTLVHFYLHARPPVVPDPSTAAIHIVCAVLEATPLQVPPHLIPEMRAAMGMAPLSLTALPSHDITSAMLYRTQLFADAAASGAHTGPGAGSGASPSAVYDLLFQETLRLGGDAGGSGEAFRYVPGTLSALWEGVFRVLPAPGGHAEQGGALSPVLKPMQVRLVEYVSYLADGSAQGAPYDVASDPPACPFDTSAVQIISNGRAYHRHKVPSASGQAPGSSGPQGTQAQVHDVILMGETLADHSHTWGAYQYTGRVTRDGDVVLLREAKGGRRTGAASGGNSAMDDDDDSQQSGGAWLFVGRLHSPALLLGRWHVICPPSADNAGDHHGVFTLGRARH